MLAPRLRRTGALGLLLCVLVASALVLPALGRAAPGAQTTDAAYFDWLIAHLQRQQAAVQASAGPLDLANPSWRRDQVLSLDDWGQLVQDARAQRPSGGAGGLHAQLLQALDSVERLRRTLLVAVATGQDPGADLAPQVRAAAEALNGVAERARTLSAGQPPPREQSQATRGNLRISVLGVQRPYLERGAPADPAWEYLLVRLRLENIGGEPLRYESLQFRLRAADDTLHAPTPLQVPDELLYGALEGNRLASQIVGTIAYAVRKGVPSVALFYERQQGDSPFAVPLADLLPLATLAPETPRPAATATSTAGRTPTLAPSPANSATPSPVAIATASPAAIPSATVVVLPTATVAAVLPTTEAAEPNAPTNGEPPTTPPAVP